MQITQLAGQLQAVGLTAKQARVYTAALLLGASTAQHIAEQAEINRPTTYDILDELMKMGLTTRTNEGTGTKSLFVAAPPETIRNILSERAADIEAKQQVLDELLPSLSSIHRSTEDKAPVVRFTKGKDGVLAALDQLYRKAKPGSTILSITNDDEVERIVPDHHSNNTKARLKKDLSSKRFVYNSTEDIHDNPEFLRESIQVDKPFPGDITLYEDSGLFVSYGDENTPWTGVVIENREIVETLRQIFMISWDAIREKE